MSKLSSRAVRAQGSQELTVTSGLPGKDITAAFGLGNIPKHDGALSQGEYPTNASNNVGITN